MDWIIRDSNFPNLGALFKGHLNPFLNFGPKVLKGRTQEGLVSNFGLNQRERRLIPLAKLGVP